MMDLKQETISSNDRLQNILQSLSKCKIEFNNEKEEIKRLRENNVKLELELKESRETEKSHRCHLATSREMIGNLQETVSQLVYLKRDIKKLNDDIASKDAIILGLEKDKESIIQKHNATIQELRTSHEKHIEGLTIANERKIQQIQQDFDTSAAQMSCALEELRAKNRDQEASYKDKMNEVVLEYEEKIQRSAALVAQLQEQLSRQAARTDANIDAYRRRLEELEEKLKQSQFKNYLAQSSYPSESQVERPYSMDRDIRDPYDQCSVDLSPVLEVPKKVTATQKTKANTLQVTYYGNKTPSVQRNEKKGQFNITKKRKLYNDKEFLDL
ncbi:lamin-A-like [Leguminivora glycinivorella]|uniref:lamin-A-like n=1 Tax=Leguminivora glycinivorella TaxID=1035111 RepID=UPI00200FD5C5|nr:lamin-A-like [Leguminivora glycinivorella]